MDYRTEAKLWLEQDPDPVTRAELEGLLAAANDEELADRFSQSLQFGTAGLRGELGAGPNRMNRIVVAQAARAIGMFLQANSADYSKAGGELRVVIGYDGRHNSDVFALDSARVLAGLGLKPMLFDRMVPTPVAAFTGRRLGAAATIMVTASHNPPRDNGYKVYLGGKFGGSQLIPPQDSEIAQLIAQTAKSKTFAQIEQSDSFESLGKNEIDAYVARAKQLVEADLFSQSSIKITHTALHGVGWSVIDEIFRGIGLKLLPTIEQQEPNGDFPTVSFPNPEEKGAMDLAMATAKANGSDLILANDPDADRLAVAVSDGESYRMLTGDEVGLLLADRCASASSEGSLANSLVSADISAVAKKHGLKYEQTLTGFKWISKVPNLIYGYEEALGYCVDPEHTPDKDGITAALLIAELAAELKLENLTLLDHLTNLEKEYGKLATGQVSIRVSDLSVISKVMSAVRSNPPAAFGDEELVFEDLLVSKTHRTDAVVLSGERTRMIFRPSGTEPKLKCYLQYRGSKAELEALESFASELIAGYQ